MFTDPTWFLVSLIDGESSVETLLDLCSMSYEDALRIFEELFEMNVITFA